MSNVSDVHKQGNCPYYIKYYPEFKRSLGSEKAAIIFERLEYWSQKYESGFWKFFEPCDHPLYKLGDSWEEEVGFSRKVFKKVFSLIGVHYKSKSAFLRQADPFQGKLYASYYDRKTNRTTFLRNHAFVTRFLKDLWTTTKNLVRKEGRGGEKKGRSRNVPSGSSFARAYKDISSLQKKTSSLSESRVPEPPQEPPQEPQGRENISQKMITIWHSTVETSSEKTILTPWRSKALKKILYGMFQNDLSQWKAYCERIEANMFLMGGGVRKWKATLDWAVRPENVQKVREGVYTGQRETASEILEKNKPLSEEEIQGSATWKAFCFSLSRIIGTSPVRAWFGSVTPVDFEGECPRIQCQGAFQRDWIQRNFSQALEQVSRQLFPQAHPVRVVV